METVSGGEIMQTRVKIALAATGFALATVPAFAVEMPSDGSKNFSTPNDAPSYFTNETIPESARVDHAATFDKEDTGVSSAAPEDGPAVSVETETGQDGRHASAHRSTKHSLGRSRGHGAPTRYAKATSSKGTRATAPHTTTAHTDGGSRSAGTAKGSQGGPQAGTSKPSGTKHARNGTRQHAAALPSGGLPLAQGA
jgi:hypothetical protein